MVRLPLELVPTLFTSLIFHAVTFAGLPAQD